MKRTIVLFFVLMLSGILASAQVHSVKGIVTGPDGNPIPGITVQVKGTNTAAATNTNGQYELNVPANATLVFTGVGFTEQSHKVGNRTSFDVTLTSENKQLNEIVVTALGIKRESRALGYSTTTVGAEELNRSKPINLATGLIGQVSGAQVSVINNGVVPEVRIQLRGERHINFDNQPLISVDGMIVRSDYLATINPEDIDNVSILKGASAAALYGSEATNGVMIITTKKGSKNGKPSISLTQTQTFEKMAYFPALQTTYSGYGGESGVFFQGTPYQFNATNPYTGFSNYIPFENQQFGPPYDGNPANGYIGSPLQDTSVFKTPFSVNGDPRKDFFVTGLTTQTDLSFSSGDSKNSNFVGLQYVNVKGTMPKDVSSRANFRFAGKRTHGIFSYDYTMNYSNFSSNQVGGDYTQGGWPVYWTLLNTLGNVPINSPQLKNWQDPNSFGNASNYSNAYYINPWWQVANSRDTRKTDNLEGVLNLSLQPTKWMNISYRLGTQITNEIRKDWRNAVSFTPYAMTDPWGESATPKNGNIAGAVWDQTILYKRIQQDIFVTLQHNFGDINATLILGNSIWERSSSRQTQSVGSTDDGPAITNGPQGQLNSLAIPNLYNIGYISGIPSVGSYLSRTRLIGGFADLTLGYKDFLFLHGNFRRDYSSLLAPGNNSYNVYGGDASWVFSENIPSFKDSKVFSYGKLGAAYSETGQITINPYQTVNTFGVSGGGYPFGGLTSLSLSGQYNNPANVPEKTIEKEVNINLGFLQNRISVGATYYFDDNLNQLFPVTLSRSTGYQQALVNAARTNSTGWEFDLKTTPIRSKSGFQWNLNGNFSIQTTTVKSLFGGSQNFDIGNANQAIVGMAFPQLYVQDLNRDSVTNRVIVDPSTGLPSVSSTFQAVGRSTPKYILGLNSIMHYKNFTFNVVADYRGGYVFYNNSELNLDFTGASTHTTTNGRQNFIYPNSVVMSNGKYVTNTNVYTQDGSLGFWASSDYRKAGADYIENAAAWKVRTISLSYDFSSLIQNIKYVKGLMLTAVCNNALMFRPKENDFTDPEFTDGNANAMGYNTYNQLPPTRQYSFILNVRF